MTKLRFPEPWYESTDRPLFYVQQIEVRKLPNTSEYFFAALPNGDFEYIHEWQPDIPKPQYSQNSFAVNFAAPPRVRAATEEEWKSASRVVTQSHLVFSKNNDDASGELEYHGKKFPTAGQYCDGGLLSPQGKWLAIFSYTGKKTADWIFGGTTVRSGDIFWQIYDTVTGEKIFEWQAKHVKSPTSRKGPVVWLEERYFLFPEEESAQNFNVVTLPEFTPENKPVTINLPSRKNDNGERVPAAVNNEVWTPLIPLTKEQAAKLTAPLPVTLLEVRAPRQSSSRQLLFAIREETANEPRHRAARGREDAADYNYRVFSTYYYAVSVDDPTQTRFASKEEWENSTSLRTSRQQSLDAMTDTYGGKRRAYRPFPKTGELGETGLVSSEWIAVLSYTPDAGGRAGKMFVDIFGARQGHKLSGTELPYVGSPLPLFDQSLWIEGDYLLLPLSTSLESFALWKLP